MPQPQAVHRAGPLKQQNKEHKHGKHRSKGALDALRKGKISAKSIGKKKHVELSRKSRRKQAAHLRAKKREEVLTQKRGLGSQGSPPILSLVIPISSLVSTEIFLNYLKSCDKDSSVVETVNGLLHISYPRFKQRFTFISPCVDNLDAILDTAKVADTIVFLYPPNPETAIYDLTLITTLFAQGLPSSVHVALVDDNTSSKTLHGQKKQLLKIIQKRFPDDKLHTVAKPEDCFTVIRQIGSQKQRHIAHRDRRPYLLVENVSMESRENDDPGILKITGYVRSQPFSVNGLIHIPGWGDFQLDQIDLTPECNFLDTSGRKTNTTMGVDEKGEAVKILEKADKSQQESLQSENVPNPMEGEQTWPTEEEMQEAEAELHEKKKSTIRVPKGTSDYQAAWIIDNYDEADDDDDVDEDDDDDDDVDVDNDVNMDETEDQLEVDSEIDDQEEDEEEYETLNIGGPDESEKYDEILDMEEDKLALNKFRVTRDDDENPDEVDISDDVQARTRFQKYRGLKSFRTSPWDPKENLPQDYARIFTFQNFNATKKRIFKEERLGAMPGWYVTLHVANVPRELYDNYDHQTPLIIFQLLRHEQKKSVVNITIKRHAEYDAEIRSKERFVFHIGFRRFSARPIFSQHTAGDKQKYEILVRDDVVVASLYTPIVFPPMPVLVFKENAEGKVLVATGNVLSVNPDRIVAKRIILSGHPFKINRKSAVVRHMFFNKEDIHWFKPIELRTKAGRRGHIKDSLGTHGHMKCVFDKQLRSNERILLNLYKRVFPKWD